MKDRRKPTERSIAIRRNFLPVNNKVASELAGQEIQTGPNEKCVWATIDGADIIQVMQLDGQGEPDFNETVYASYVIRPRQS